MTADLRVLVAARGAKVLCPRMNCPPDSLILHGRLTVALAGREVELAVATPPRRESNRKLYLLHWLTGQRLDDTRVRGRKWDEQAAREAWAGLVARHGESKVLSVIENGERKYPHVNSPDFLRALTEGKTDER